MPVHEKKLSDGVAAKIKAPEKGYVLHWCPETPGFGLRVTANGARAWIAERRVDGQTVRRTLGAASGRSAITAAAARALQVDVSSELQRGTDRLEVKRERRRVQKIEAVTFETALRDYTKLKRRAKDALPLKARTVADYLAMIEPAGTLKSGRPTLPGELYSLASKSLAKITGPDISRLHADLAPRGERRQTYALQVLRAVLRHHGTVIEDNPLAATTAGAKRVRLAPSRGKPTPIPSERLGAWWRAACAITTPSADMLRFMLLTGARPGEASKLLVGDVDFTGKRAVLRDTKNRADHVLVLAPAAAGIVFWHSQGKKAKEHVFGIADTGRTLATINKTAETLDITPHKLRHTFATIAAELVPAFTLRKLLNHSAGGDVAAAHYVGVSEAQLRDAWQAVADFIEKAK